MWVIFETFSLCFVHTILLFDNTIQGGKKIWKNGRIWNLNKIWTRWSILILIYLFFFLRKLKDEIFDLKNKRVFKKCWKKKKSWIMSCIQWGKQNYWPWIKNFRNTLKIYVQHFSHFQISVTVKLFRTYLTNLSQLTTGYFVIDVLHFTFWVIFNKHGQKAANFELYYCN